MEMFVGMRLTVNCLGVKEGNVYCKVCSATDLSKT
jgi:hypothetical protein